MFEGKFSKFELKICLRANGNETTISESWELQTCVLNYSRSHPTHEHEVRMKIGEMSRIRIFVFSWNRYLGNIDMPKECVNSEGAKILAFRFAKPASSIFLVLPF